jgi:hypothetical protein
VPYRLPFFPFLRLRLPAVAPPDPNRRDDYALHWQLLPYDPHGRHPRLLFNIMHPVAYAMHGDQSGWRPITSVERNKPACRTMLDDMTFFAKEFPDFKIEAHRAGGVVVGDVLDAIHETFQVPLTRRQMEAMRAEIAHARPWFEHRCAFAREHQLERPVMCRYDLLAGRTIFAGVEWIEPCHKHPDGAWTLLFENTPSPPPPAPPSRQPSHRGH